MQWLRAFRATPLLVLSPLVALTALALAAPSGCSNSSSGATSTGPLPDASGANVTELEAGSACGSATDCQSGLVCLYPASATSTCNSFKVCVAPPPSPCPSPTVMCSCLVEPVQVCQGYAENPVDPTITCEAGAVIPPSDGGEDGGADSASPADSAADSAPDATDAAGD